MKVSDLMTSNVASCKMDHSLACSARIMWERDCGCVPIVDGDDRVVGMITDRDICMAALTRGEALGEIPVHVAATKSVTTVTVDAAIEVAEALMQERQVRRVPVVDRNGRLKGILSMNDIARRVQPTTSRPNGLSGDLVAQTLAAISAPHGTVMRTVTQ
jgi:CBS domain-containing protein